MQQRLATPPKATLQRLGFLAAKGGTGLRRNNGRVEALGVSAASLEGAWRSESVAPPGPSRRRAAWARALADNPRSWPAHRAWPEAGGGHRRAAGQTAPRAPPASLERADAGRALQATAHQPAAARLSPEASNLPSRRFGEGLGHDTRV